MTAEMNKSLQGVVLVKSYNITPGVNDYCNPQSPPFERYSIGQTTINPNKPYSTQKPTCFNESMVAYSFSSGNNLKVFMLPYLIIFITLIKILMNF